MNESLNESQYICLEMVRRFISRFDGDSAEWLIANDELVGDFLRAHLDRLTAAERLELYTMLFGFFRKHYKQVLNIRLQMEQDPKCRERLTKIEELNREALQGPYSPITDDDLLASSESNLLRPEMAIRYLGALAVWLLTKNPQKVVPTLLGILNSRNCAARIDAAKLLGEVRPLDQGAIRVLQEIANDTSDEARFVAVEALRQR